MRDKDTHRPAGRKGPAKGRDRTESHNKEYKKRRAQKRESISMRDKDTRNTAGRKGPEKEGPRKRRGPEKGGARKKEGSAKGGTQKKGGRKACA